VFERLRTAMFRRKVEREDVKDQAARDYQNLLKLSTPLDVHTLRAGDRVMVRRMNDHEYAPARFVRLSHGPLQHALQVTLHFTDRASRHERHTLEVQHNRVVAP